MNIYIPVLSFIQLVTVSILKGPERAVREITRCPITSSYGYLIESPLEKCFTSNFSQLSKLINICPPFKMVNPLSLNLPGTFLLSRYTNGATAFELRLNW